MFPLTWFKPISLISLTLVIVLVFLSGTVWAQSAIECHCFRERSYTPQSAAAADPYFLATAQNSLLAAVYRQDKKQLVRAKMAGRDAAQLWITHDLAARSGRQAADINQLFIKVQSWPAVIRELGLDPENLGAAYVARWQRPAELSALIVDRHLQQVMNLSAKAVEKARKMGMTSKELIVAALLSGDPQEPYAKVKSGAASWSRLLFEAGYMDGTAVEKAIQQRLSKRS